MSKEQGRIAILMHSMLPGGSQYRVIWFANRFVELGREVDLLLINRRGDSGARIDPRVRVIHLAGAAGNPTGLRSWLTIVALALYLRRVRPAVLMSGVNLAHTVAMRGWRAAGRPAPVVLRLCNSARHFARGPSLGAVRRRLWGRDERLYGEADAIIAVSRSTAEDFKRIDTITGREIEVIYNPTASRELLARPLRDRNVMADVPTLLGAGTLFAQKDFATMVRAFAILRASRPARLVILGDGEERSELVALADELGVANDVALPGWSDDVPAALERADLLVSSSRFEGLQGTLIEALALGCPVVATDCPGGNRETLEDGKIGWLVRVGDPAAMAEAMAQALDTPVDSARLRASAMRFGEEGKAEAYLRVFDEAAARRSESDARD